MQKNILKDTHSFLSTILFIFIIFTLNSCEDEKHTTTIIPIENTTEIITNTNKNTQSKIVTANTLKKEDKASFPVDFILKNENKVYHLSLSNNKLTSTDIKKPIILINIFQENCIPCQSQSKSYSRLEKKYKNSLFILTLFNNKDDKEIINFSNTLHSMLHTDTDTSPLSIIYKNGTYYNHFDGLIPTEMLNHAIQQAIKK